MNLSLVLSLLFLTGFMNRFSQAAEYKDEAETALSRNGLIITHSKGASCYDEDRIYKFCVDQNQLFKLAQKGPIWFKRMYYLSMVLIGVLGADLCIIFYSYPVNLREFRRRL